MRTRLTLVLFVLLILSNFRDARAVEYNQVPSSDVEYTFGKELTIEASFPDFPDIESVEVFIRPEASDTFVGEANLEQDVYVYNHDLSANPMRAFAEVEYWFRVTTKAGEVIDIDPKTFYYEDNRFDWKDLSEDKYQVHWYDGDTAFGQTVLDTVRMAESQIGRLLELPTPESVQIYAYANGSDMQSTLRLAGIPLVAGHADPELSVIVVTLPPGPDQRQEIERQIPHELMHILLYQAVQDQYYNLPTWLKEGLASIAELKPNPDYYILLNNAVVDNTFIPMEALCNNFPTEAASFYLSYAQSASFTRYLYEQYGQGGLRALVERYSEGLGCNKGAETALGKPLSALEQDWRRSTFGEDKAETAFENILPWLGIFVFALIVPVTLMVVSWLRRKNTWDESNNPGSV